MAPRIQSIQRAAAVLQLLTFARRQLGVGELAGELQLSKATVFGILQTLRAERLVEQDAESRKYRLGPALLVMGAAYRERNELLARARRGADALAAALEHGVRLGTRYDGHVMVLHHVPGAGEEQHPSDVGLLLPLGSTALGRVLVSGQKSELVRDFLRREETTTDERDRLLAELDAIPTRGWTWVRGEPTPWQDSIAAPISDHRGAIVAAIAISGPSDRLIDVGQDAPHQIVVYELVSAARAVSRAIGIHKIA